MSAVDIETPPGLVLKPWISQGSFASAGTCRIRMPWTLCSIQLELDGTQGTDRNACPAGGRFRDRRLALRDFVRDIAISV
jgi:hypothetical protein